MGVFWIFKWKFCLLFFIFILTHLLFIQIRFEIKLSFILLLLWKRTNYFIWTFLLLLWKSELLDLSIFFLLGLKWNKRILLFLTLFWRQANLFGPSQAQTPFFELFCPRKRYSERFMVIMFNFIINICLTLYINFMFNKFGHKIIFL